MRMSKTKYLMAGVAIAALCALAFQNTWKEGFSFDGLHPTEAAAGRYAANIAPVIIQAVQ